MLVNQTVDQQLRQAVVLVPRRLIRGFGWRICRRFACQQVNCITPKISQGSDQMVRLQMNLFMKMFVAMGMAMRVPVRVGTRTRSDGRHRLAMSMCRTVPAVFYQLMQHRADANRTGESEAERQVAAD